MEIPDFIFFNEKNPCDTQDYRCADNSIHMERLEPEHLLYPKPGNCFRFSHHNSEDYTQ